MDVVDIGDWLILALFVSMLYLLFGWGAVIGTVGMIAVVVAWELGDVPD